MLHPKTNPGKIKRLEMLHLEYVDYVRLCVSLLLGAREYNLSKGEMQKFFPKAKTLTSQIQKNARHHAITIVSTWAKSNYAQAIKPATTSLCVSQR